MFGQKLNVRKIDVQAQPDLARQYQIHSLPTLIIGGQKFSSAIEEVEVVDAILHALLSSVDLMG